MDEPLARDSKAAKKNDGGEIPQNWGIFISLQNLLQRSAFLIDQSRKFRDLIKEFLRGGQKDVIARKADHQERQQED